MTWAGFSTIQRPGPQAGTLRACPGAGSHTSAAAASRNVIGRCVVIGSSLRRIALRERLLPRCLVKEARTYPHYAPLRQAPLAVRPGKCSEQCAFACFPGAPGVSGRAGVCGPGLLACGIASGDPLGDLRAVAHPPPV